MARPLLTARWSNLALLTYNVDADLLRPLCPPSLTLDTRDGQAFLSLVAFQFHDAKLMGMPMPGATDFPEINLRFYVRKTGFRGVCFIREFVPVPAISFTARKLYNEPYITAPIRDDIQEDDDSIVASYYIDYAERTHSLTVTAHKPAAKPERDALETFLLDQQWGFGVSKKGELLRYEVEYAPWRVYEVMSYAIDIDFASLYGPDWAFLNDDEPQSIILAEGSPVQIFKKTTLMISKEKFT